jgi:hypothetical protein
MSIVKSQKTIILIALSVVGICIVPAIAQDKNTISFDNKGSDIYAFIKGQADSNMEAMPAFIDATPIQSTTTMKSVHPDFVKFSNTAILQIDGTLDGQQLSCTIENGNIVFGESDSIRDIARTELAKKIYLDRISEIWNRTHDLRSACPSTTDTQCTGNEQYVCTHTPSTVTQCDTHSCAEAYQSGQCIQGQTTYQDNCHDVPSCQVSCSNTHKPC